MFKNYLIQMQKSFRRCLYLRASVPLSALVAGLWWQRGFSTRQYWRPGCCPHWNLEDTDSEVFTHGQLCIQIQTWAYHLNYSWPKIENVRQEFKAALDTPKKRKKLQKSITSHNWTNPISALHLLCYFEQWIEHGSVLKSIATEFSAMAEPLQPPRPQEWI